MESWLNDALTTKKQDTDPDEPPLELLQQGAAALHGLQNFNLTRADLKQRGLSPKSIERIYRSMYVYTVGFHDILKELFGHCEDKADLVTSVWSGFVAISENTLKSQFKSEFLEMLGEKREMDVHLHKTRDHLASVTRDLVATRDALSARISEVEAAISVRDQLIVKHRQLKAVVEREQVSRQHVQQKYFAEVEHRTAMAEEVAESRELADRLQTEHDHALRESKRAVDQAVRSDAARRQAQENLRRYLEELKILRERDTRQLKEVESLKERLSDATTEMERSAGRYQEEVRSKILLQADLAGRREVLTELNIRLKQLEEEMADWQEDAKDSKSREQTLVTERDLLRTQLASTTKELSSTQDTLLRERAGYSQMTAEWGQMIEKVEDLTIREGAAVKRGLALSADLEEARGALRAERVAHAASCAALERTEEGVRSLGVAVAWLTQSLSDERIARHSLLTRLSTIAALETHLRTMEANEKLLRENLESTQKSLDAARSELNTASTKSSTLAADYIAAKEALNTRETELTMTAQQLDHVSKNLEASEHVQRLARAESARMSEQLLRCEEKLAGTEEQFKKLHKEHHDSVVRGDGLQRELNETKTRSEQANGGLEEAVKKLNGTSERLRQLETDNMDATRRAENAEEELSSLKLDREYERNQRERAEMKHGESSSQLSKVQENLDDAERRLSSLEFELSNAAAELQAAQGRVQHLEEEMGTERSSMEGALDDEREGHAAKSALLDEREMELAAALADISALTAARDQLSEDSQQLERMLKEAQTVRAFLQGEIGSYKTRCEQYKAAKAEAEVKIDILHDQMERAVAAAVVAFNAANGKFTANIKDLTEDLEAERAARRADVDVVRAEGSEQVKAWRESLMAEIGTERIQRESAEKSLEKMELDLEKARGDASMAARVSVTRTSDLERRLAQAGEAAADLAMSGDEEKQHKHALGAAVAKMKEDSALAVARIAQLEQTVATLERQLTGVISDASSSAADAAAAASAASAKQSVTLKWVKSMPNKAGDLVVIKKRDIFERDADAEGGGQGQPELMNFTPKALRIVIMQILCEKVAADVASDAEHGGSGGSGSERQSLEEFTYDFFLFRFGLRAAAERHLRSLVDAVERDYATDPRVQVFARMIGVVNPLPDDACDFLLRFLARIFQLTTGPTAVEFTGGETTVSVSQVSEAAVAPAAFGASPEGRALVDDVTSTAAVTGGDKSKLDLDLVTTMVLKQWERTAEETSRAIQEKFLAADANGDGLLAYDEFSAVVKSLVEEAGAGGVQVSARTMKTMFREALSMSSENGSAISPQAFAATLQRHGFFKGPAGNTHAALPIAAPLAFEEWGLLEGSWDTMKPVMQAVLEMLGSSSAPECEGVRGMIGDFEGMLKARSTSAKSGWALYRRILVVHATHQQRMELREMESKRLAAASHK